MLDQQIIKTLLYYDIFEHPLSARELFQLLPENSITRAILDNELEDLTLAGRVRCTNGFYFVGSRTQDLGSLRMERQKRADRRFLIARIMAHVIKRFPFVRGIFVSGDLSKGVASPDSDIDLVIVTAPNRLWICRSFLIAFKKVFLLNRKKYFCLNYFIDTEHLKLDEQNYYTATEIAHLKPLYNFSMFLHYMNANNWIRMYFPTFHMFSLVQYEGNNRRSILQVVLESFFIGHWVDRLDSYLLESMKKIWKQRYPQYDDLTRRRIFRSSKHESRAFAGNFADRVLLLYDEKLLKHNISA